MPDVLTHDQSAGDLFAEMRAAGLTLFRGPNGDDLRVTGDETALDFYDEAIRAHKAAILERVDAEARRGELPSFCAGASCRWYEPRWRQCRWRSPDGRNWTNVKPAALRHCPARPT